MKSVTVISGDQKASGKSAEVIFLRVSQGHVCLLYTSGLRIGNTEKLQEFQMTVGEDAYLAVFINTENVENAKSFIKYIYGGGES